MFTKTELMYFFLLCFLFVAAIVQSAEQEPKADAKEDVKIDEEKLQYAKGSACGYCEYCKFCKLCDKDCPCETSPTKPNCKMCKYCKFCHLCSALCDTICQPGGIIDKVSAAIVNALPSHDPDEIDKDLQTVKPWLDKKKDEL